MRKENGRKKQGMDKIEVQRWINGNQRYPNEDKRKKCEMKIRGRSVSLNRRKSREAVWEVRIAQRERERGNSESTMVAIEKEIAKRELPLHRSFSPREDH